MPIYEYACAACGHEFEEWQKMSDPPVRVCPKCKKKKVERLISRTAFQLKGGGWYADLYSSSKPGQEKNQDGKKAEGDGGAGAKTSGDGGESSKAASKSGGSEGASGAPKKKSGKKGESRAA